MGLKGVFLAVAALLWMTAEEAVADAHGGADENKACRLEAQGLSLGKYRIRGHDVAQSAPPVYSHYENLVVETKEVRPGVFRTEVLESDQDGVVPYWEYDINAGEIRGLTWLKPSVLKFEQTCERFEYDGHAVYAFTDVFVADHAAFEGLSLTYEDRTMLLSDGSETWVRLLRDNAVPGGQRLPFASTRSVRIE